jgi:predicted nucleic acid-binding protein
MVPAVLSWHEHHPATAAEIGRRLTRGEPMYVAAPALVEAYAVLTRLPAPHRLSPSDALALLDGSFVNGGRLLALDAAAYRQVLHRAPAEGIAGGRTYDAVIANCALRAKVSTLLTFNERHFLSFAAQGWAIAVPRAGRD